MRVTCVFTVVSERNSLAAISELDRPRPINCSTSTSRSVSSGGGETRPGSGRLRYSSRSRRNRTGASSASPAAGGRDEHDDHEEPRHELQVVAGDCEGRRVRGEYPREGEKRSGPPPHQRAGHQHAEDGVRQARPVIDRAVAMWTNVTSSP